MNVSAEDDGRQDVWGGLQPAPSTALDFRRKSYGGHTPAGTVNDSVTVTRDPLTLPFAPWPTP